MKFQRPLDGRPLASDPGPIERLAVDWQTRAAYLRICGTAKCNPWAPHSPASLLTRNPRIKLRIKLTRAGPMWIMAPSLEPVAVRDEHSYEKNLSTE